MRISLLRAHCIFSAFVLCLGSSAFAESAQNAIDQLTQQLIVSRNKAVSQNVDSCSDFSGDWLGICEQEGMPPRASAIKIEQLGCALNFSIGSEKWSLGDTTKHGHDEIGLTWDVQATYLWSPDKTQILQRGPISIKIKDANYPTQPWGQVGFLAGRWNLENNRLIQYGSFEVNNYPSNDHYAIVDICKYSRR